MRILLIGTLLLQVALSQQTATGTLEGVVFKPGGTEPVAGAGIKLTRLGSAPKATVDATTGDDGRFELRGIQPGEYTLSAESSRYGHAEYGQRRSAGPATILSVAAGQRVADLRITMFATGVITGRVASRNGEPVVRASVYALRRVYEDGSKVLVETQATLTDDLGNYRLYWLPAGEYLVATSFNDSSAIVSHRLLPPGSNPLTPEAALTGIASSLGHVYITRRSMEDGSGRVDASLPVYHPGSIEATRAAPVRVMAGATAAGVDIAFSSGPVLAIRGQLVGPPAGQPLITLVPRKSPTGIGAIGMMSRSSGRLGPFEVTGVAPGSYFLLATDARNELISVPVPVDVADQDVTNVTITLRQALRLTGNVVIEDPNSASMMKEIGIRLTSDISGSNLLNQNSRVNANGSFAFMNLPPIGFQVAVIYDEILNGFAISRERPEGMKELFVKSIRLGSADGLNGIRLDAGSDVPLEIVLTTESGALDGVVEAPGRTSVGGATIVLVPAIARRRTDLYKAVTSDAQGRFQFREIAPGDYKVFAFDDIDPGAWQDSEFMKPHESRGVPIRIQGRGQHQVQVGVIPIP